MIGFYLSACDLRKFVHQLMLCELGLFLALNIENDVSLVHHDEAGAVADGVLHVVGYHHCGEIVFLDDAVGKLEKPLQP